MKLIPRYRPAYNYKEILAACRLNRNSIAEFEKVFSARFGCQYGVMFSYGRTALYALLKIWGLNQTEVICPAYTCSVVPQAIVLSGNVPVFVDCAQSSFNMSLEEIKIKISENTRAIVVTHLFGYPMDVYAIQRLIDDAQRKFGNKIYVIQDAAHSFGCRMGGELVTKFGDAAIFGLSYSKTINSIYGGMAITNDENTYKRLLEYRWVHLKRSGWRKSGKRVCQLLWMYFKFNNYIFGIINCFERIGRSLKKIISRLLKHTTASSISFVSDWNQWPAPVEARIGLVQLDKYESIINRKREAAKRWINQLSHHPGIKFSPYDDNATYSHCVALVNDRKYWTREYLKQGIQLGVSIDFVAANLKCFERYKQGEYPVSQLYAERIINFPV